MAKWTYETVIATLKSNGLDAEERNIDNAIQFTLPQGTRVNLYTSTFKVLVQGKKKSEEYTLAKSIFPDSSNIQVSATATNSDQPTLDAKGTNVSNAPEDVKVFIVYGHDKESRDQLELMLLRMNIKPVILSNLAPDGKTIIEALMANSDVPFAIVLLTPDDEGHKEGKPEEKKFRARQNVVLELGMFLMKLGREKVAILHKGNIELPSDIHGLIYIPFTSHIQETKNKLAASLQKAGFFINIDSLSAE